MATCTLYMRITGEITYKHYWFTHDNLQTAHPLANLSLSHYGAPHTPSLSARTSTALVYPAGTGCDSH